MVAEVVGWREVRGDSGGAVPNNPEARGWWGQYGFAEDLSLWGE